MVSEILNVLTDYHYKKKLADKDFVFKICMLLRKHYDLGKYVQTIMVLNDKRGPNSLYSFSENVIIFNLNKCYFKKDFDILKDEYYGMYNLLVLKIIIHEFEHVLQEQIKDSSKNNIERKLLILGDPTTYISEPNDLLSNISFKLKKYRYTVFYNTHYFMAPFERLAIIKSCVGIKEISNIDFITNSDYYTFFNIHNDLELNHILSHGYYIVDNITSSPSLNYLYKLTKKNRDIILNDKSFYDYSLLPEDRLLYGLSLTKEECDNIDNVKDNLVKKIGGLYE